MRRSTYNDYRPLRIVLLLLLVVLGLFLYIKCAKAPHEHIGNAWEVTKEATCTEDGLRHKVCTECETPFAHESIPAIGHAPKASVTENEIDSTCTKEGSHDVVVYCGNCDEVLSKETIVDAKLPHTEGKAKTENFVDSQHATAGSYDSVVYCTECNYEISRVEKVVEPKGHQFLEWSVNDPDSIEDLVITGKCECGEEIHVTQGDENCEISVVRDERYAPCCKNIWFVTVTYTGVFDGEEYVVPFYTEIELEPVSHKILVENVHDVDGNVTYGRFELNQFAKYDDAGNIYFDYSDKAIAQNVKSSGEIVWDDNGFASANVYIVCVECDEADCAECDESFAWITVRLYSAENDKNKD